jgi:osmoprotectant transport system permease protein
VAALESRLTRQDRLVLLWLHVALIVGLAAAVLGLSWISLAPNRLVAGQPLSAREALGDGVVLILAAALAAEAAALVKAPAAIPVLLILGAVAAALAGTGAAADGLLQGRPSAARMILGSGFWICLAALAVLALDHARAGSRWLLTATAVGLAAIVLGSTALGLLDSISLVVEYGHRREALHAALIRHLALALGALALGLAMVLPVGWAAFHRPRIEAIADAVLGAVQVTPSIALFGLLIPLLAGLLSLAPDLRAWGIGAIGATPTVIGVAVYLALPLLRGLVGGLRAADPAAIEAARALGFSETRTTLEVRVPLSLPVLVGALRVATVQSIGLVTLGGLVGAGGLGALVFEGMAQFAADLIVLGALPIVGLALAADLALAALAQRLETTIS